MSFMLQVQQGKIENKKTKNDNNNENHEKTRKETGKKKGRSIWNLDNVHFISVNLC